jgi:hypothetical protein
VFGLFLSKSFALALALLAPFRQKMDECTEFSRGKEVPPDVTPAAHANSADTRRFAKWYGECMGGGARRYFSEPLDHIQITYDNNECREMQ